VPELQTPGRAASRSPQGFGVATDPWWQRLDEIAAASTTVLAWQAAYRLGDGVLVVATDCDALIGEFADHYGECEVSLADPDGSAAPRVLCTVHAVEGERLALVRFESTTSASLIDDALALLMHPASQPEYIEGNAPGASAWRLIVHAASSEPAVAVRGHEVLVDVSRVGARQLGQLLIDPVLALQRGLLFAHAASVGIGGAGVLLVGPSGSGKTTTAITLASRGHRYFGDDVAALRTETAELLPFWRIAHVRPGLHARSLAGHMTAGAWDAPYADGLPRLRLRVADVFPTAASAPLPLRRALFLRGFASRPRLEPFNPTGGDFAAGSRFALNNTLWVAWGKTPQLRLLQFMLFMRLLERVPCAWLDAGEPEATADLIEHSLEDSWH
jgi:hypothetical protein